MAIQIDDSLRRRFAKYVRIAPSGCHEWTGARHAFGYGLLKARVDGVWRHTIASRISVLLSGREIPDGMKACHRCDNPPCVNPEHLFVATQTENLADMTRKGRRRWAAVARGEQSPVAKLTDATVTEIKKALALGAVQQRLANDYGVSKSNISAIANGRSWTHVVLP